MSLGANLTRLRRQRSMTQGELSEASGVKVGHISKLERDGETDPKISTVRKLMKALDCSADELLCDPEEIGPKGRLKGIFQRAEQLPEEPQQVLVHLAETYCEAYGLKQLIGDKPVLTWKNPFGKRATG